MDVMPATHQSGGEPLSETRSTVHIWGERVAAEQYANRGVVGLLGHGVLSSFNT